MDTINNYRVENKPSPENKFSSELREVDSCEKFNELMQSSGVDLVAMEVTGPEYSVLDGNVGYIVKDAIGNIVSPNQSGRSWISFDRAKESVVNLAKKKFANRNIQ